MSVVCWSAKFRNLDREELRRDRWCRYPHLRLRCHVVANHVTVTSWSQVGRNRRKDNQ